MHGIRTLRRPRAGYSLVEVMIATVITGVALAGIGSLLIFTLNLYYYNADKLQADRNLRSFTDELARIGTGANFFRVYTDFLTRTSVDGLSQGDSGDCLVFAFVDQSVDGSGLKNDSKVNRIVVYYRDPDTVATSPTFKKGPVRKYDSGTFTSAAYSLALLPNVSTLHTNSVVIQTTADPTAMQDAMFYNFKNRSVVVKAQIIYSGLYRQRIQDRINNIFNFTVSPRG